MSKRFHCTHLIWVALALLTGCGGSQPPIAPLGMMLQTYGAGKVFGRSASGVPRDLKNENLIYAAGQGHSYVISANTGKLVGTINTGSESVCSDGGGNVWLTGQYDVLEFAHGGTTPIATLYLPGTNAEPIDCAVDPTTGNLAVTFAPASFNFQLAVFTGAQGSPTIYSAPGLQFCGYDDAGNLFLDGYGSSGATIAELPRGASSISYIGLGTGDIGGSPWEVQWDGKYVTVEGLTGATTTISRLEIAGSKATIVGQTRFKRHTSSPSGSWIAGGTIVVPWGHEGKVHIGTWPYPKGGEATKLFTDKNFGGSVSRLNGLTVSVPPH